MSTATDVADLPIPAGATGRRGLIWLIHEHELTGDPAYPHRVLVTVIDGTGDDQHVLDNFRLVGWRVPSITDEAYVFAVGVEHQCYWGPLEMSHFAGTVHRKCQHPGCPIISALDDDPIEEDPDA